MLGHSKVVSTFHFNLVLTVGHKSSDCMGCKGCVDNRKCIGARRCEIADVQLIEYCGGTPVPCERQRGLVGGDQFEVGDIVLRDKCCWGCEDGAELSIRPTVIVWVNLDFIHDILSKIRYCH